MKLQANIVGCYCQLRERQGRIPWTLGRSHDSVDYDGNPGLDYSISNSPKSRNCCIDNTLG